ncbi:colanic acid biosynthesis protein [Pseudomonas saudimassiliensis]|uniref:Colanic acid biosynthesis protein n=1 Tax=Pseudomonas saudimassiliensis TaxID=1461581 RepID=A0A078MG61_9PSED|nr:polysaccharide pyruvyl transferase family protein [Pseudomonas saudimassiliensis]CEA06308.1 colanic acid biosynthesis protein [Pseudomonas saudimassiliensis]CEF27733.1 colanic acid biosynthesis protein [Pseudomonas saudimassiliensis]
MKAIIIPGVTDLNKGDQCLVWESYRILDDCGCFDEIRILENGDTEQEREALCGQSKISGFSFCHNILKHPRRGKHVEGEHVKESFFSFLRMAFNAIWDFVSLSFLLLVCNKPNLVQKFYSKDVVDTVRYIGSCDLVAVKGGGFIHSYGERRAPYIIWFFLFYIRLAIRLNKKVVILPNSFGPFEGLTVSWQVKRVLRKCGLIYARENVSSRALSEILGRAVPVYPDLGFFLKADNSSRVRDILDEHGICESRVIGVTVRPWRFPGRDNPDELYEKYVCALSEFVKHLVARGYKVAFCNQSIGPNAHEDDRNAIDEILTKLEHEKERGDVFWINENLLCTELKAIYSNFYALVGTRFHSVIFAITSLVPALAIGYGGNKANGIMGDLGVENMTVPIDAVSLKALIDSFSAIENGREDYVNKLSKNMEAVFSRREIMVDDIFDYVSK